MFVDGFNLYHAIADLGVPHLKWVSLTALGWKIVRRGEVLSYVVWCTAVNRKNYKKMIRWRAYRDALESEGVICREGHFTEEPRRCDQGHGYFHPTEKEGDVNVAISVISDAHLDKYDVAYVVSADSDQLATIKMFIERFPSKQIVSVAPPKRSHSKDIIQYSSDYKVIKQEVLENCLLPGPTIIKQGKLIAVRPASYEPPPGWSPAAI